MAFLHVIYSVTIFERVLQSKNKRSDNILGHDILGILNYKTHENKI